MPVDWKAIGQSETAQELYDLQAGALRLTDPAAWEAHRPAMEAGALCAACPLFGCRRGPVPSDSHGASGTAVKLHVVGDFPGPAEVAMGVPFAGQSGVILNTILNTEGLYRGSNALTTNAIACRPDKDNYDRLMRKTSQAIKAQKKAEKAGGYRKLILHPHAACRPRLSAELDASKSPVVLAVGGMGLGAVAHFFKVPFAAERSKPGIPRLEVVSAQHGAPLPLPHLGVTITASLHPNGALRDKRFIPVVRADIKRACDIANRGGQVNWSEPELVIMPSADEAVNFVDSLRENSIRENRHVVLDLETDSKYPFKARIRCIGFAAYNGGKERVISVPFRKMNGQEWWSPSDKQRVAAACYRLLEECKLAGHNVIGYDSTVLLNWGLLKDRSKKMLDTMLLHHDSQYSELAHDLGFVAARNFEAPAWKANADAKSIEGVDDRTLARYNALDCLVTLRLIDPLSRDTIRSGMRKSFENDTELALVARDMGALGLVYDIPERIRHYEKQTTKAAALLRRIRELTNDPEFNPNSVPQVRNFLFVTHGLIPALTSEGEHWIEGSSEMDEASTDEASMQALLNHGVPPVVADYIEAHLEFKAATKLIGTYIQLVELNDEGEKEWRKQGRATYRLNNKIYGEGPTSSIRIEDWTSVCGESLAVLHASFKIHVTPSGRFAATPNVLAWPKEMRSMIRAPPGHVFIGGDAEQLEARLFAIATGDQKIWDAFKKNIDLHTYNWATMNKDTEEEAYAYFLELMALGGKKDPGIDHCRTIAKVFMYSLSYGSEVDTLFQNMSTKRRPDGKLAFPGLTLKMVQDWYDAWHRLHPETKAYFAELERGFRKNGYVASLLHDRRRYMLGGFDRNAAANMPMQCLPARTRVLVDRGWVPIGELHACNEPALAYTGTQWAAARVMQKPAAQIVKLHLSNGQVIECDVHHKVKVPGKTNWEWKTAAELKPGTTVALQLAKPLEFGSSVPGGLTKEESYWAGYFCGNGWVSKDRAHEGSITIGHRAHLPMLAHVERFLAFAKLQKFAARPDFKRQGQPAERDSATYTSINCYGPTWLAWLQRAGFDRGATAHTKRVPSIIAGASLELRKAFLQGMFDADAYLAEAQRGKTAPAFRLCNEALIRDLHLLGLTVGLDGRIAGPYKADREGHQAWVLTWFRAQVATALERGEGAILKSPVLAQSFEAAQLLALPVSSRGCKTAASAQVLRRRVAAGGSISTYQLAAMGVDPFHSATVERIEFLPGEEATFTLSVDAPEHSYSAEGLISKNSTGADLMNEALLDYNREVPHRGWSPLSGVNLQVHDAIYAIVPEARGDEAAMKLKKCMTKEFRGMPFPAAVKKPGRRWSDV